MGRIWKVHVFRPSHIRLLNDRLNHAMLVHVVRAIWITLDSYADKLLVCCISYFVFVVVECFDDEVCRAGQTT